MASRWLARRDFCRAELAGRLAARGFDAVAVEEALLQLTHLGAIDDARYAERFVTLHARRGQGPLRIQRELADLRVAAALVEQALERHETAEGGWVNAARAVRARRFGAAVPSEQIEWARQARFLQFRGFSTDHIRGALGHLDLELT